MNRDRFPGLRDGWARLDGPAGTQMVDAAIGAMADFMRSGHNANHGGLFAAARQTDELVASARASNPGGATALRMTASSIGRGPFSAASSFAGGTLPR